MPNVTHLADLRPDPENRRQHNPRNLGMVVDALQSVGAARSIVIDEDNVVLAGNGVIEAAAEAGITGVRVVDADGSELIAVRRSGMTAEQKRALAIYDNRTAELAEWNPEQLAQDLSDGHELGAFWTQDELATILRRAPASGQTDPDALPELRPTTITEGDIFALGQHRLLCGDATNKAHVGRLLEAAVPMLMVTDPPYGVAYDATWRATAGINRNRQKMGAVTNDHQADWGDAWQLFPGAVAYVWHGGLKANTVQASLEDVGLVVRSQIIWVKDRLVISRGDYHWQHEPCWYAVRENQQGYRTEDRKQTTVWEIASTVWRIAARDDDGHGHSTQKPVECMARAIRNHNTLSVYDPFVGSGTTLIAAEQLARQCFAIEIDPVYVQMSVDRWEAFTGKKVVKVGEAIRA